MASYPRLWWRDRYPQEVWVLFEDFRYFLAHAWQHLNLPEPTKVQYDLAYYLQHGPRRRIIQAFRGVGKSWITSAFAVWCLLRDPQENILVISASKDRSDSFTSFTLRLIREMPVLQHLEPGRTQRCSMIAFDVAPAEADHSPSMKSVGITGQITGTRADRIIADDVEVPKNSATQTQREQLSELVKEFDSVIKPGGEIIYLGTPQTEESLYNVLGERGYETRIWPARFPTDRHRTAYGEKLAPIIGDACSQDTTWKPTDPERFDDLDLIEREASYGRSGFDLQFMLNTALSDLEKYPLRLEDLIIAPVDKDVGPEKVIYGSAPEQAYEELPNVGFNGDRYYRPMGYARDENTGAVRTKEWDGSVLVIDPSGRGPDESGYVIAKMLNSQIFIPEAGGVRGHGYDEKAMQLYADLAKKHEVNLVLIEENFGDGMFSSLLHPYLKKTYPCTIEEVKHSIQKEQRIIDTLEPVMNQHRLIIDPSVVKKDYESTQDLSSEAQQKYRMFYQMTRITRERGSLPQSPDRLDALAMAVAYWVEQMGADIDDELDAARKEREEIAYAKFLEAAGAQHGGPSPTGWIRGR